MKAKNLNPEYLDTPKQKIIFKGKAAHKVTALELLAIEEARIAIKEEKVSGEPKQRKFNSTSHHRHHHHHRHPHTHQFD